MKRCRCLSKRRGKVELSKELKRTVKAKKIVRYDAKGSAGVT